MGSVEECCLVCADPLEWTAIGPCGHNLTCSQCVARLRFVLHDKRCTMCQQDVPQVLFTRYMGDYTARLTVEQIPALKARVSRGELYSLPEVDGYFDDQQHFAEMKALVGYQHPVLTERVGGREPPTFTSFPAMKKWIESNIKVSFCDLCVTGRKVFICEQLVYDKASLDKHNKIGDDTGPMAESGFKGHPMCKFCKQRFYDSSELYRHMESQHEHCFMCRREHPDKYVYYRHYKELEEHFMRDHQLCPHPECLEKRFIVFGSEAELKRHFAIEHGDDMKMSRAARREAMTIPINLQYRRGGDDGEGGHDDQQGQHVERPGVVIGGGQHVMARHGPRGGNRAAGGRGDTNMVAAVQASLDSLQVDSVVRESTSAADADVEAAGGSVTFQAEDFPTVGPGGVGASGIMGRWAGSGNSGVPGSSLTQADFPALPTLSKAARKRQGQGHRTLAERLAAAAKPIRVVNKAAQGTGGYSGASSSTGGNGGGGGGQMSRPSSSTALAGSGGVQHLTRPASGTSLSGMPRPASGAALPVTAHPVVAAQPGPTGPALELAPVPGPQPSPTPARTVAARLAPAAAEPLPKTDDFPSLPGTTRPSTNPAISAAYGGRSAAQQSAVGQQQQALLQARFASAAATAAAGGSSSGVGAGSSSPHAPAAVSLTPTDFPSLGDPALTSAAPSRVAAAWSSSSKQQPRQQQLPLPSQPALTVQPPAAMGGVSERLKSANRELIDKCRQRLTDEGFAAFRQESGRFMRGDVSAEEFHRLMVSWGLLSLATELAVLCPNLERRQELMAAHRAYLESPAAQDAAFQGSNWVPPEAALAASSKAEACPSWPCPRCTLINAPEDRACEACNAPRPAGAGGSSEASTSSSYNDFPALGPPSSNGASFADSAAALVAQEEAALAAAGALSGKRGKKVIRLGALGAGSGSHGQAAAPAVHPQNVWTQPDVLKKRVEKERQQLMQAQASKGQWAADGGNKIAKRYGAINDAWGGL